MSEYIFSMHKVGKLVQKREILKDISLSFYHGAKIGILGINGSGKSTLLRVMAGIEKDILGEATPQKGIKIGYLQQEPQLDPAKDVRGNVEKGVKEIKDCLDRFNEISLKFAEPMSDDEMNALLQEQGELQNKIEIAHGWELDRTLEMAADALRLPPWDSDVTRLSGGERRRVALCELLLSTPDMLLLDEPTNHLDAESVAWLERYLHEFKGTVVAVTHDCYFLDNVAGWILELDRDTVFLSRVTILLGWIKKKNVSKGKKSRNPHIRGSLRQNWNGFDPIQKEDMRRVKRVLHVSKN